MAEIISFGRQWCGSSAHELDVLVQTDFDTHLTSHTYLTGDFKVNANGDLNFIFVATDTGATSDYHCAMLWRRRNALKDIGTMCQEWLNGRMTAGSSTVTIVDVFYECDDSGNEYVFGVYSETAPTTTEYKCQVFTETTPSYGSKTSASGDVLLNAGEWLTTMQLAGDSSKTDTQNFVKMIVDPNGERHVLAIFPKDSS